MRVILALVVLVCIASNAFGRKPSPPPYPGGVYSYGRAFGRVTGWYRNDVGSSHHLEVNFSSIVDLDTRATYNNFQANMNVRSNDGSPVLVAILNGSAVTKFPQLSNAFKGPNGIKKLTASSGISYSNFLSQSQFAPMNENAVLSLYEQTIQSAMNGGEVLVFGQLYSDSNGAHGIHDVHRIVADNGEYKGYGDGGFFVRDSRGTICAVLLHFNNQPCCK